MKRRMLLCFAVVSLFNMTTANARIGQRFPSEKRIVPDPVTGIPLTLLTSTPAGYSKIYQTHNQWTSDGKWIIFRSRRVPGQAMAVNEETGVIVQVTESGYSGMLCVADHSMHLKNGIGIVNLRTREMRIAGQVPIGDPGRLVWHVHGSPDGRWAVADDL
jgi:oligogalacturonide lyase